MWHAILSRNPGGWKASAALRDFFDYEAYGNYLDTGGSFAITNHGVFEICT